MTMKVVELRAALEARGEAVSGNKAWLRRRLHTAVVRAYLAAAARRTTGVTVRLGACRTLLTLA